MIFHTGDVRRNCIKIQLAELPTGLSRYRQTGPHFGPPLPSPLKIRLSERRISLFIIPSVRILSKVEEAV